MLYYVCFKMFLRRNLKIILCCLTLLLLLMQVESTPVSPRRNISGTFLFKPVVHISKIFRETTSPMETSQDSSKIKRETTCGVGKMSCPFKNETTNSEVCFSSCQKCDGVPDCPKATEESNCPCRARTRSKLICDGKIDCSDYTDELGCGACLNDELRCSEECISLNNFCNGRACSQFARSLLCTRLTSKKFEESDATSYRSKGYLQKLVKNKWLTVCGTFGGEINLAVNGYCQAVTGVRNNKNFYKFEETSVGFGRWSDLHITQDNFMSAIEIPSCPQSMVVYVECTPPPCQDSSQPLELFESDEPREKFERIVGGVDASPEVWSFLVRVIRDGEHHCGGSILTPRWVLSASHCFFKISRLMYEIEAGSHQRGTFAPNVQRRIVSHVIRHPEYNAYSMENDVALVRLMTPLQFNRWTRPVCLSEQEIPLQEGVTCLLAGWGFRTEEGNLAETAQEVAIPVLKEDSCVREFININPNPQKVICAGYKEGRKDSCQGDSGGPMMCHLCSPEESPLECENRPWYQAAIVSYGRGCARPGIPGVYTKIEYYRKWIFDEIDRVEKDSSQLPAIVPRTICDGLLCLHSSGLCLIPELICDGKVHCLNALDEADCDCNSIPSNTTSLEPPTEDQNFDYDYDYETDIENQTEAPTSCPQNHYQCEVYPGCVPNFLLCDETRNCRDGTDELGCTCVDRLLLTQKHKICDGVVDCLDFTDEFCDLCGGDKWLCRRSAQCIHNEKRCDSVPDCRYGEDELHCLALTPNEGELIVTKEGNPLVSSEGYLLLFSTDSSSWDPICVHEIEEEVGIQICSYLGFQPPLNIKYNSSLPFKYEIREETPRKERFMSIPKAKHDFRFSDEGLTVDKIRLENFKGKNFTNFIDDFQILRHRRMITISGKKRSKRVTCNQVKIECGEKICGKVHSLHFSHAPPLANAGHVPWAVSIFHSGTYLCGGTLVGMQWVVSSIRCLANVTLSAHELHILGGSNRGISNTSFLGPNEVDLRVDAIIKVDEVADLILLHLDKSIKYIEHMNAVCLEEERNSTWKECLMVGRYKENLNHVFLLVPNEKVDCPEGKMCFENYFPLEDVCVNSWSGLISCREERKNYSPWTAVAIWNFTAEDSCQKPPNFYQTLSQDLRNKIKILMADEVATSPPLMCHGHKCSLGMCIPASEVCDAKVSCPDLSDESLNCPLPLKLCRNSVSTKSCDCFTTEFKCDDGVCLNSKNICDGVAQCLDGEDEENCKCALVINPSKGKKFCDGVIDCRDESDELQCKCDLGKEFRCFRSSTQNCIPRSMVCDAVPDCSRGEDEAFCFTISDAFPEENALGIPAFSSKGYFLLRVKGKWYTYNSKLWNSSISDEVCSALGYTEALQTTAKRHFYNIIVGDLESVTLNAGTLTSKSEDEDSEVVYIECLS